MLWADMAAGAGDRLPDVAKQDVDLFERRPLRCPAARSGAHWKVIHACFGGRGPAGQTIADSTALGLDLDLGEALHLLLRKPLTVLSVIRLGRRSKVFSIAAMNGVLSAAPLQRLPPER